MLLLVDNNGRPTPQKLTVENQSGNGDHGTRLYDYTTVSQKKKSYLHKNARIMFKQSSRGSEYKLQVLLGGSNLII